MIAGSRPLPRDADEVDNAPDALFRWGAVRRNPSV
jgi:hypothetical protein